jgi:hypothetical protein
MTEFKCKKCGSVIAKKDGNILMFKNTLLTLFNCELVIPCENIINDKICTYTLNFVYKPERKRKSFNILQTV